MNTFWLLDICDGSQIKRKQDTNVDFRYKNLIPQTGPLICYRLSDRFWEIKKYELFLAQFKHQAVCLSIIQLNDFLYSTNSCELDRSRLFSFMAHRTQCRECHCTGCPPPPIAVPLVLQFPPKASGHSPAEPDWPVPGPLQTQSLRKQEPLSLLAFPARHPLSPMSWSSEQARCAWTSCIPWYK